MATRNGVEFRLAGGVENHSLDRPLELPDDDPARSLAERGHEVAPSGRRCSTPLSPGATWNVDVDSPFAHDAAGSEKGSLSAERRLRSAS